MTIKEIQDGIINQIGYLYDGSDIEYNDAPLFAYDVRKCTSLLELVVMLGQYGYDRQGAIGVLDGIIVTNHNQNNKNMTNELRMRLEIVKSNISSLVDYLDENRLMETIPDPIWKYILAIEKAVEYDVVELEQSCEYSGLPSVKSFTN